MDKLKLCADEFNKLININYYCIIGRKGKTREFTLTFNPFDFHHLAGLHKLADISVIRGNRERIFKNIISEKITYEMISKSLDFPLIESRLNYLYKLQEFMDSNSIIFNYEKRNNVYSNIDAVYLLQNEIDKTINYLFIDKNNDGTFFGRSFFPQEQKDYTIAQQKWTLLYKEKTDNNTNIKIIQYNKLLK